MDSKTELLVDDSRMVFDTVWQRNMLAVNYRSATDYCHHHEAKDIL